MIEHDTGRRASFRVGKDARRSEIIAAMQSIGVKRSRVTIHTHADGSVDVELRPIGEVNLDGGLDDLRGRMNARGLAVSIEKRGGE